APLGPGCRGTGRWPQGRSAWWGPRDTWWPTRPRSGPVTTAGSPAWPPPGPAGRGTGPVWGPWGAGPVLGLGGERRRPGSALGPRCSSPLEMVEGARSRRVARARSDSPAARPREISSRTAIDSRRGVAGPGRAGGMPPVRRSTLATAVWEYPKDRPIERWDSPASHRLQMSAYSSPVKALLGRLVVLATLHLLVPSLSWIFVGVAWTDTGQGAKASDLRRHVGLPAKTRAV